MYMVHTVFRREFGALPNLVWNVQVGDIQRSQIIGDHIDILSNYLYAHHHSEDIHLWPRLLDRAPREVTPEHMCLEEQRILPLAEKYTTAAEWHAMAGESGRAIPQERVQLVFGMTLYEANPEAIQKTLSELQPEVRGALQEQGPRAFSSHSERVHGTATPPRGAVMRSLRDHRPWTPNHLKRS